MRNKNAGCQNSIENFAEIINFNFSIDGAGFDASALFDVTASNLSSSSRIRSGRVSSSYSSALLVESFEFTGVDSAMLGSTRTGSSPALSNTVMTFNVENKFSVDLTHIFPIKHSRTERISYSKTYISKEQSGSLNSKVNRYSNQECECAKSEVLGSGVRSIHNGGQEHAKTEEISQGAVNSRTLRAKNNWIAARASQNVEW